MNLKTFLSTTGAALILATAPIQAQTTRERLTATTETYIRSEDKTRIPFQRFQAQLRDGSWGVKTTYDFKPLTSTPDIGSIHITHTVGALSMGAGAYRIGDAEKSTALIEAEARWKSQTTSLSLRAGARTHELTLAPQHYAHIEGVHQAIRIEGALYTYDNRTEHAARTIVDLTGSIPLAVGLGVRDITKGNLHELRIPYALNTWKQRDLGSVVFGYYDTDGEFFLKNKTAIGNIAGVYSVATTDLASRVFTMPQFYPVHFTDNNKGDITLTSTIRRNTSTCSYEGIVGKRLPADIYLAAGARLDKLDGLQEVLFEGAVPVRVGPLMLLLEGQYNAMSKTGEIYLTTNFKW